MIDPKVVFEPVLGRWRVEYRTQWTDEWQTHRYHHTLEEACEVAQEMTNNDLDGYAYRVVDTQPEEVATGRRIVEDVITGDQIAKVAAVGANLQWSKPSDLAEMSINAHQLTVPLTMDAYQEQAKATAVYPEDKAREYLVAGLAGEVGEVASLFAKHWRADQEWLDYSEVAAELGDVLWFITMLADEVGYDLTEVAQGNLDKLADRAERGKLKGSGDNR